MYMLSGCELIDTKNISLPSQNMKLETGNCQSIDKSSSAHANFDTSFAFNFYIF